MRNVIQSAAIITGLSFSLAAQVDRVPAGSEIVVRTNETVDAKHPSDSRIYSAVVDKDVTDRSGRVVIPRGADAELIMRDASDSEIVMDLESVNVNGRRYTVNTSTETLSSSSADNRKEGVGANERTGKYVGGGALIGSIIGAIAGGGKGAAIGAVTGAGAGAVGQTVTRGGRIQLPAESLLTFRLNSPLAVGAADSGFTRDGRHYHRNDDTRSRRR
jgi:bifunctional DNA-binding transcriptional regulator/antitoxin component of YhaV-PrlF toxin-antitoxin module